MNQIQLKGEIRNIGYSHNIGNIIYDKAELMVLTEKGEEIVIPLRFKHFSNKYSDGQHVELSGNIRSYSEHLPNGKNKVHIYVFTYFDQSGVTNNDTETINNFTMDGRICKLEELRCNEAGKQNIHFILANNILSKNSNQKLNTYLPCVAFGTCAQELANLRVSDKIQITGHLNARIYKKLLDGGEMELRTAYEGIVDTVTKIQ